MTYSDFKLKELVKQFRLETRITYLLMFSQSSLAII